MFYKPAINRCQLQPMILCYEEIFSFYYLCGQGQQVMLRLIHLEQVMWRGGADFSLLDIYNMGPTAMKVYNSQHKELILYQMEHILEVSRPNLKNTSYNYLSLMSYITNMDTFMSNSSNFINEGFQQTAGNRLR